MAKINQDDEFYLNNDRVLKFTLTDDENGGAALNLTGFTLYWAMSSISKKGVVSPDAVLEKKTGGAGITVTGDPLDGLCQVAIADTDTVDFAVGDYHHELEAVDGGGQRVVQAEGTLTLLLNVGNTL